MGSPMYSKVSSRSWLLYLLLLSLAASVLYSVRHSSLPAQAAATMANKFPDSVGKLVGQPDSKPESFSDFHASRTKYMFNFGDSYTDVQFRFGREPLPTEAEPLGKEWPGRTSAMGTNYIGYLTGHYNKTRLLTFDIAQSGATVDAHVIKQTVHTNDFGLQMQSFRENVKAANWRPEDTLFTVWFGVNDVNNGVSRTDTDQEFEEMLSQDMDRYFEILDDLWDLGARRIVLLSCPPFDLSPSLLGKGARRQRRVRDGIALFNSKLVQHLTDFKISHDAADAPVSIFDTAPAFHEVIEDPVRFGSEDATCSGSSAQCLWPTALHPGPAIHKRMAEEFAMAYPDVFDASAAEEGAKHSIP